MLTSIYNHRRVSGDWVDTLEREILFAHDPETTNATRIQVIIESKYCPTDLRRL